MSKATETKMKIIEAGEEAIKQLIIVAKEKIIVEMIIDEDNNETIDVTSLKNAASTKKLAIFDAFDILERIESERDILNGKNNEDDRSDNNKGGFAERRATNR